MIKPRKGWYLVATRTLAVLMATCALLPATLAQTSHHRDNASPDLEATIATTSPSTVVRVILNFRDSLTISSALMSGKATLVRMHLMFGLCVVDIKAGDLAQLLNSSEIVYAVPNRAMQQLGKRSTSSRTTSTANSLAPPAPVPSGEAHVRATTAVDQASADGAGLAGAGIAVAVIDSGIYEHPDLMDPATGLSRVIAHVNYASDAVGNGDPYGHGTHVAGLIAGNGSRSAMGLARAYAGVAPGSKLVDLRVLRADGSGTLESVLQALQWVLENGAANNVKVVNLSVGTPPNESFTDDPLCRAVNALVNFGYTVVVAAGNSGKDQIGNKVYGGILSPANAPLVITVGAANTFQTDGRNDDGIASYSSRGPTRSYRDQDLNGDGTNAASERDYDNLLKPDLAAPGNKLVSLASPGSALLKANPKLARGSDYMELSGTSMAAPVVSGSAALLLQARADLKPSLIKALLMYTAQPLLSAQVLDQGAGIVNVAAARDFAAQLVANPANIAYGTDASPLDLTSTLLGRTIGGQFAAWGKRTVLVDGWYFASRLKRTQGISWGAGTKSSTRLVWGNGVFYTQAPQWSSKSASGSGLLWGDGVLWADAALGPSDLHSEAARLSSHGLLWSDGILWGDTRVAGDGILWGDGLLWGDGTLSPDGILWGDGLLWGDGILVGDGILWGDGLLWGDGVLWGDGILWGD